MVGKSKFNIRVGNIPTPNFPTQNSFHGNVLCNDRLGSPQLGVYLRLDAIDA